VRNEPRAFAYHFFTPTHHPDSLSEGFFLRNLVEQMAEWHHETGLVPAQELHSDLVALFEYYLERPAPTPHAIVVDGLDEVTTWDVKQYLRRPLPDGIKMILTSRDTAYDSISEYGLPARQTRQLALEGLSRAEVADVLRQAGGTAEFVSKTAPLFDGLIQRVAYPTNPAFGADPFYVRILADELAEIDDTKGESPVTVQHGSPISPPLFDRNRLD
jgi:hypothetical protein